MTNMWAPETVSRRDKVMQELHLWLLQLPAELGKTLSICTPADILVFMESHWVQQHAGTTMSDGSCIASPAGVNQCLSNLSTGFQLVGRIGDWCQLNPFGNAIKSIEVTQYRQGYRQKAFQIGYLEGSAVPMTQEKVFQLVDYLDSAAAATPAGFKRLVLERNTVMILLMWESYLRGKDCGKMTLGDFFYPHGEPVCYPLPSTVPGGFTLLLAAYGTKTVRGQRAAPISVTAKGEPAHSFVHRLVMYLHQRCMEPPFRYLFSPLTRDQQGFKDEGMTSSAIGKRVKQHLETATLYAGESKHGFRRGHIQADAAAGVSTSQIGLQAQIKTSAIVELYKNPIRHLPRAERLSKRPHALISQP